MIGDWHLWRLPAALNQTRKLNAGPKRYHNGIICAFAGFLALSALNLLLVIILGTQHNPGTSSHQKGQNMSSQGAVTGTQYGTGAGVTPAAGQGYGAPVTMVWDLVKFNKLSFQPEHLRHAKICLAKWHNFLTVTLFKLSACVLTCIGALVIGTIKSLSHKFVEKFLSVFHQDRLQYCIFRVMKLLLSSGGLLSASQ